MKTTYELLGMFWDGKISADKINYSGEPSNELENENKVLFSELMSVNNEDDYYSLISARKLDAPIVVFIDYWPECNRVISAFLDKRLRQIVAFLSNSFREVLCVIGKKNPPEATNN